MSKTVQRRRKLTYYFFLNCDNKVDFENLFCSEICEELYNDETARRKLGISEDI